MAPERAPGGDDPAPEQVTGLRVRLADGVLRLVLDRPERRHALTAPMVEALSVQLERASSRDDVRVVLVTGAGGVFSAGADVAPEADGTPAHERLDVRAMDAANRLVRAVVRCERPVVAAVAGPAAGVAVGLALACDLVVAEAGATFLLPFTRLGLLPDGGATATVAAAVGRARAMRLALLAEPLGAVEAHAAGLVSHLVEPPETLDGVVEPLLARLAAGPPLALTATKRAVNAATLGHLDDVLERERSGQVLLLRTADAAEGLRAFAERRSPTFRGE